MFQGMPSEQFHQFIASRTSTSSPSSSSSLPLSFPPLHGISTTTTSTFPTFLDSFSSSSHHQVPFLHPLHQQVTSTSANEEKEGSQMMGLNLEIERERSMSESVHPWSNEEVLALLRIRSTTENWFPEFTWEHVSRKLAELGFKRSAEKCKEKFEEENRYFSSINYNKNYRVFSELEELYSNNNKDQNHQQEEQLMTDRNDKNMDKPSEEEDKMDQNLEEDTRTEEMSRKPSEDNNGINKEVIIEKSKSVNKKRKRIKKFEMFKGFCEDIVKKMMSQQEEMHNKLLEDMVKRDEEKVAREEAWKKQEMERFNKELEARAHEQALAGDRQTMIIKFLKNFTSSSSSSIDILGERSAQDPPNGSILSTSSSSLVVAQNPNIPMGNTQAPPTSTTIGHESSASLQPKNNQLIPTRLIESQASQNPSSNLTPKTLKEATSSPALVTQNPNSLNAPKCLSTPKPLSTYKMHTKSTSDGKEDLGKRWPRDEVLALINLRCSLCNNTEDKEGAAKAPLWERISQGMFDLGYKRSAKRCKEKWENINKYFRKTKDLNKKRSVDSRTCPYFHQLSTLYNEGTLVLPPENHSGTPLENHETKLPNSPSQNGSTNPTLVHVAEGEKNIAQVADFDFEF